MKTRAKLANLARATWVHAASAALVMGSWAGFANRAHGVAAILKADLVQAALSAAFTLSLKKSLEALAARFRGVRAYVVPPLICCTVVLALLWTAHALARTPEIWTTIAVPYTASSLYAWVYTALTVSGRKKKRSKS